MITLSLVEVLPNMIIWKTISLGLATLFISLVLGQFYDHQKEYQEIARRMDTLANQRDQEKQAELVARQFSDRVAKVQSFLGSYSSPLADYALVFIRVADRFGLDYRLLPSIAGKESTFCKFIRPGTHNCWGWNRGNTYFVDYPTAIETVGRGLATTYDTSSIRSIAYRFAPPFENNTEKWIRDVEGFMSQIE